MKSRVLKTLNYRVLWLLLVGFGILLLAADSEHLKGLTRSYPQGLIGSALVLLAIILYRESRTDRRLHEYDPELASLCEGSRATRIRSLAFVIVWVIYPLALSTMGFIVATTLSVATCLWLVRVKSYIVIIGTSALFSVALAVLITSALYIPTPSGPIDDSLTRLLYAIRGR